MKAGINSMSKLCLLDVHAVGLLTLNCSTGIELTVECMLRQMSLSDTPSLEFVFQALGRNRCSKVERRAGGNESPVCISRRLWDVLILSSCRPIFLSSDFRFIYLILYV